MKPLRPLLVAATLFATGSAVAAERPPTALAADRPVVVELFTSQGCSSCPPADALLGELTRHADVLPLAFHVDFWNRLGWKDPSFSAASPARQRTYAPHPGPPKIYTAL